MKLQVKQQVHEEMEKKDQELMEARTAAHNLKEENTGLNDKLEKLQKAGNKSVTGTATRCASFTRQGCPRVYQIAS